MLVGVGCVKELAGRRVMPTFRWELSRLLAMFRRRKATDPKDKVYALLGLSEFDLGMGYFTIDYAKDVKQSLLTRSGRSSKETVTERSRISTLSFRHAALPASVRLMPSLRPVSGQAGFLTGDSIRGRDAHGASAKTLKNGTTSMPPVSMSKS